MWLELQNSGMQNEMVPVVSECINITGAEKLASTYIHACTHARTHTQTKRDSMLVTK